MRAQCDQVLDVLHALATIASTGRLTPALRVEAVRAALEAQRRASELATDVIALECDEEDGG